MFVCLFFLYFFRNTFSIQLEKLSKFKSSSIKSVLFAINKIYQCVFKTWITLQFLLYIVSTIIHNVQNKKCAKIMLNMYSTNK